MRPFPTEPWRALLARLRDRLRTPDARARAAHTHHYRSDYEAVSLVEMPRVGEYACAVCGEPFTDDDEWACAHDFIEDDGTDRGRRTHEDCCPSPNCNP